MSGLKDRIFLSVLAASFLLTVSASNLPGGPFATMCGAEPASNDDSNYSGSSLRIEGIANLHIEGVQNLHKVSDDLYRSAQPTGKGMRNLDTMGIKTVVNLRSSHSDRDQIGDTRLGYEHIHMSVWHPKESQVVNFLRIVTDRKRTPVLVHCQHGADRTGLMCAIYRIAVQGWTKEEALKEMTGEGFGFHGIWVNLIHWINKLDIERIKEKAGIKVTDRVKRETEDFQENNVPPSLTRSVNPPKYALWKPGFWSQ